MSSTIRCSALCFLKIFFRKGAKAGTYTSSARFCRMEPYLFVVVKKTSYAQRPTSDSSLLGSGLTLALYRNWLPKPSVRRDSEYFNAQGEDSQLRQCV